MFHLFVMFSLLLFTYSLRILAPFNLKKEAANCRFFFLAFDYSSVFSSASASSDGATAMETTRASSSRRINRTPCAVRE